MECGEEDGDGEEDRDGDGNGDKGYGDSWGNIDVPLTFLALLNLLKGESKP